MYTTSSLSEKSSSVASLYESVGSSIDQLNAIVAEYLYCHFVSVNILKAYSIRTAMLLVCPTYLLLDACSGKSFKGEYAIPPASHGDDMITYFPTFRDFGIVEGFNNTNFINIFTQGFLSFVANLDPNVKLRSSIAPVRRK
ncbi:hypothetical protein MSAN_01795900 [Mycena sanguinolenta]|uniref:Uncharacterized protein n=1 Tax=Mycena sanguinolenta TaxID=230812 RepID=A0A8H7CU86_9AGAR|nr:hypothetical protein MSAN_01795900 [Mycena sanguinolenta]